MSTKTRLTVTNPNGILTVVDANGQEIEGVQGVRLVCANDPKTPHTVQITLEGVAVDIQPYLPLLESTENAEQGPQSGKVHRMRGKD